MRRFTSQEHRMVRSLDCARDVRNMYVGTIPVNHETLALLRSALVEDKVEAHLELERRFARSKKK